MCHCSLYQDGTRWQDFINWGSYQGVHGKWLIGMVSVPVVTFVTRRRFMVLILRAIIIAGYAMTGTSGVGGIGFSNITGLTLYLDSSL